MQVFVLVRMRIGVSLKPYHSANKIVRHAAFNFTAIYRIPGRKRGKQIEQSGLVSAHVVRTTGGALNKG